MDVPAADCVVVVPGPRFRRWADEPSFVNGAVAIGVADAPHPRLGFARPKGKLSLVVLMHSKVCLAVTYLSQSQCHKMGVQGR